MGKQRAKRKQKFWHDIYKKELEQVPETGFKTRIETTRELPIIARKTRFLCSCGKMHTNYAGFSPAVAYVCPFCGAVYRVCGFPDEADAKAFANRPNPKIHDWCKGGEAIQIKYMPDPELLSVPYKVLGKKEFSFRWGKRSNSPGVHFEMGKEAHPFTNRPIKYFSDEEIIEEDESPIVWKH